MKLKIGAGIHDVTGACVDIAFMGMSDFSQLGEGIHSRLFSRAFVIEDVTSNKSVVIVCADLCFCSQALHQAVLKKLAEHFKNTPYRDVYTRENVLISGTHTHSGAGGYSYFLAYNTAMFGFKGLHFDYIAAGIFNSIIKAHENKTPGKILIASGELDDCGDNRSLEAYKNNPREEREAYGSPVDKQMTLLKFVSDSGAAIGSINWFALHPTNMGAKNKLVSSDNKGYAQELFEKNKSEKNKRVISAFANSCCGDVSPNVKYGLPDGIHDFERTKEFGLKQYKKAGELFDSAQEELQGSIDYRQTYIDMNNYAIGNPGKRTWPAAMGLGMSKGSMEDSKGMGPWGEGMKKSAIGMIPRVVNMIRGLVSIVYGFQWPSSLPDEYIEGHGEKPILFPWGLAQYNGMPTIPHILPLQLIKLGGLVLVAHPGEMTTMAGRRMRKSILDILAGTGVKYVVIAAYAGAYSSYTTTPEEYDMQQYEGASTLYGPWTFDAYRKENCRLAEALKNNKPVVPAVSPPDFSRSYRSRKTGIRPEQKPLGANFGDVEIQPKQSYKRGEEVLVSFWGGHPNNNFSAGESLLAIEEKNTLDWRTVYTDKEFCTIFQRRKRGNDTIIEIRWMIPDDQEPGVYRVRYNGYWKESSKKLVRIQGLSNEFTLIV